MLLSVAVEAVDDGGRCPRCGKLTMAGGNHLCKSRKKSRSVSFAVHNSSVKSESEKPKAKVEKKPTLPPELEPSDGTYADEVISTTNRVWTDETGRKIEASWMHVSKDHNHVFLKSEKTKRRLDVSLAKLSSYDQKYVTDYINAEEAKSNVWLRGVFVDLKSAEAYRQKEKAKSVIRIKDSIASAITKLRVFQVLGNEALCRPDSGSYDKVDGTIKFIPAKSGFLVDGDSIERRFFWCGTYNYETRGRIDRTVHCLTDDPKFAIEYFLCQMRNDTQVEESEASQSQPEQSGEFRLQSTGSGFFVTEDGYLITNHHVVEDGRKFAVLTEAGRIEARVINVDRETDLALLKVDGVKVKPFKFSSRRSELLGTSILTMGFPQPGLQGFDPKVTRGIISSENGFRGDVRRYQIDASVQPGNSGGPVFNEHGCIVGVVVSGLTIGQVINYCIKKSYLLAFVDSFPECSNSIQICEGCGAGKRTGEDVVASVRKSCVLVLNYK